MFISQSGNGERRSLKVNAGIQSFSKPGNRGRLMQRMASRVTNKPHPFERDLNTFQSLCSVERDDYDVKLMLITNCVNLQI
jgi:hypothetical protein